MPGKTDKIAWRGVLRGIQPRIRLMRSFDQRHHTYLGYVLRVDGVVGEEEREFLVAVGKGAQEKHGLRASDRIAGLSLPVEDERSETAELYKTSGLEIIERAGAAADGVSGGPPWLGVPPPLEKYRERGHRRLDARTYEARCTICMWGCRMPVDIIVDHWKPDIRQYRFETFCYGPLSCPSYRAGATRKVPGRRGMSWEEEDWMDEEATGHRGPDE